MLIFFHGLPNLRICSFGFAVSLFRDPPRLAPASSRRRRRVITLYFVVVQPLCLAAVVAYCRRVDYETMDYDTMADNV